MFSLNEGNRFVMAQHPNDMRMGVNAMCGQVRMVGLDPANGDVYVVTIRNEPTLTGVFCRVTLRQKSYV